MTDGAARRRFRRRLLVVFLAVMIVPYARQIVSSPTGGQDFRAFFAAATVVAHHGDPYNWSSLSATEYRLYDAPAGLRPGDPGYYEFLAYPEGPWLAFSLAPLTGLPWRLAYALYDAILGLILLAAGLAMFTVLGWPRRRIYVGIACTVLSAIGFINFFMGQASIIVFGAFVAAWFLAGRGRAAWAGALLALVWIKPNIGLALPIVVMLMEPAVARRIAAWFVAATAVAFGVAATAMGTGFLEWPLQVPRMWQAVQGAQPDIASAESFFYPGLSGWLRTAALAVTLLVVGAYGGWALRRAPGAPTRGLTLLLIWLFALPFVQSYDLILLAPAVAVLLGPTFEGWDDPLTELTLWTFMTVPFFYYLGFRLGYFNGFSAIPLALLVLAWHRRMITGRPAFRQRAAAA